MHIYIKNRKLTLKSTAITALKMVYPYSKVFRHKNASFLLNSIMFVKNSFQLGVN
jgi:hypothetical protein